MGKVCSFLSGRHRQRLRNSGSTMTNGASMREALRSSVSDIQVLNSTLLEPSVLSGRRRSLLVGINYYGTRHELHGCVNDVKRILPLLANVGFGSDDGNQLVLTDEPDHSIDQRPTRSNILKALAWLAEGAQAGDALFFHYSGHGGREHIQEGGALQETLVPVDFDTVSMITDNEMFDELVAKLPKGCRLTCLFDSYHGVEAPLALPFTLLVDSPTMRMAATGSKCPWTPHQAGKRANSNRYDGGEIKADVLMFAGCWHTPVSAQNATAEHCCLKPLRQDSQSSSVCLDQSRAPGGSNWGAGGVLTSAILELLRDLPSQPTVLFAVLENMRKHFKARSSKQAPLIAASRPFHLQQRFALDTELWN